MAKKKVANDAVEAASAAGRGVLQEAYKFTLQEGGSAAWTSYFPVRVELTRRDIHRIVLGITAHAQRFKEAGLNAYNEVCDDYRVTAVNLDSALKFKQDENFILLTKTEYDKLTKPATV
jgi:hypothetical protein